MNLINRHLAMLIGLVTFSQQGLAQQTAIEMAYKFVEPETRIEFNKWLAELEQKKVVQGRDDAVDGLKASLYGRAVIQAGCIAEFCMITRKGIKGEDVIEYSKTCNESQVNACIKPKLLAYVQFMKSVDDYIALDRKQQTGCLLKSRLFDLEVLLPPFDFLKQRTGNELHDYKLLNECYLSKYR